MPAPIIPWSPCNIPSEIQAELDRRRTNRGFKYVSAGTGDWGNLTGEWSKYNGPMVPWIRLCSNSMGLENQTDKVKPGFIFYGGKDFYTGYGFNKTNASIIGYLPDGNNTPHTIPNDLLTTNAPIHVPPPEIEKISVTIQKELFRRATIDWVCFSKAQLEYMTPYFLIPGITCILEWGWNHYNPDSLLDLSNITDLQNKGKNPYPLYTENILRSNGNYDVLFGRVTSFEWSIDNNKFKCKTEITSQDRLYAGLVVNSTMTTVETGKSNKDVPLGNLISFVGDNLSKIRSTSFIGQHPTYKHIYNYIESHLGTDTAQDYIYGVFYGRDASRRPATNEIKNNADFDQNQTNDDVWINFGLLIEIINYYSSLYTGTSKDEAFRIDINDVVINAHPNLISTDGDTLLIPNAKSPHYHYGYYGKTALGTDLKEYIRLEPASIRSKVANSKEDATKSDSLADYRLATVCRLVDTTVRRDDLDSIINWMRYDAALRRGSAVKGKFSFPFYSNAPVSYPARISGHLKDLYFNVKKFKSILESSDVKTYKELVERILKEMSKAAVGFWDFKLVAGTGKANQAVGAIATMTIIDNNFCNSSNFGKVYQFDYGDADSLLLGISFKPTLSNAQAIRTIYAKTNNPDLKATTGQNELLDYKFRDRLATSTTTPSKISAWKILEDKSSYKTSMESLQKESPPPGSFQVSDSTGIRRLVLPDPDILRLLLDDGDVENNPTYTGIMPGIQAQFTIQGIGGLRTFMMFLVKNIPEPYSHKNIVFRIVDVQETVENGKWITVITAGVIPLRGNIKKRLGLQ